MVRSDRAVEKVETYGATPMRCSLGEVGAEHLEGVDAVVHTAAKADDWGTYAEYYNANVVGTQRLLDAAREVGAARFVHISSTGPIFTFDGQFDLEENAIPYQTDINLYYGTTKAEAERRVLTASAEDNHNRPPPPLHLGNQGHTGTRSAADCCGSRQQCVDQPRQLPSIHDTREEPGPCDRESARV